MDCEYVRSSAITGSKISPYYECVCDKVPLSMIMHFPRILCASCNVAVCMPPADRTQLWYPYCNVYVLLEINKYHLLVLTAVNGTVRIVIPLLHASLMTPFTVAPLFCWQMIESLRLSSLQLITNTQISLPRLFFQRLQTISATVRNRVI